MSALRNAPDSQFAYVVLVARRARQLMVGGRPMVDNPRSRKNTRIAEEELQAGMLEYELSEAMAAGLGESNGRRQK